MLARRSDGSDIVVQDAAVTRNGVESSEAIVLKGVDVVWNGWRLIKVPGASLAVGLHITLGKPEVP